MSNIIKEFPMLYGIATNGKIKTVRYWAEKLEDGTCVICNEHGYEDGKKQVDRRNIRAGKNIGKKNETSISEQAVSEAESKWKKKQDDNYTTNSTGIPDQSEKSLLPMLAHKFKERKHNITYPALIQPKLDGLRCLVQSDQYGAADYTYTSRKFKPYDTLKHLNQDLFHIFGTDIAILDGEIYKHGLTLQEINRRVKKFRGKETEELEFWVFDMVDENLSDLQRQTKISEYFNDSTNMKVVRVPNYTVNSEEEVKQYHDRFVQQGFEGVIIRNLAGKYALGERSADLQKYKEFLDSEFEIVGTTSGEGREKGAIIFTCKTPEGKTFEVRPRGTIEDRIKMMQKPKSDYIGKKLTVRYFAFTEDNIPQFPVGIIVREDIF